MSGWCATLPAFLSIRAMVRAHVEARSGHAAAWQPYLRGRARVPPSCAGDGRVAIGGLPGSGKSTLARALAPGLGRAPGALILRSDEIRKRQHGVAPEQRLPQSAYSDAASQAVFAALADGVRAAAGGGHCVVADATFIDPAHRRAVEAAAQRGRRRGSSASGWTRRWLNWNAASSPAAATPRMPRSRCCMPSQVATLAPEAGIRSILETLTPPWLWCEQRCDAISSRARNADLICTAAGQHTPKEEARPWPSASCCCR